MFSGIVETTAQVISLERSREPYHLQIESSLDHQTTRLGDSICIDGVCLTVVSCVSQGSIWQLGFDLAAETLRRTGLGSLSSGSRVNIERSLAVGDRLHGHFVFGHVDGMARLVSRHNDGNCDRLEWQVPVELMPFIAEKGSVALSGVSLTVGEVSANTFYVYIIPHTSEITSLSGKQIGDQVNIEVDMLARYVQRQLSFSNHAGQGLNKEFLKEHGFRA